MNDADDYEALAAWEEAHPEENVGMWLWNAAERLGRVEAIITDLAAINPIADPFGCFYCSADFVDAVEEHASVCVWRRAVDYRKDTEE